MENGILDWDSVIDADAASSFDPLPEGDYDFVVEGFERAIHKASAAIPQCPQANVKLAIIDPETGRKVVVREQLILYDKMEWKLSQFFRALGLIQPGGKAAMNWPRVPGAKGRCKIFIDKYTGNDGKERTNNKVERYYDPPQAPEEPKQSRFDGVGF